MKKRNFITGFSAAFVAFIALTSCGGIRAKDNVVLTVNGVEYTAIQLFGEQKTPASAEAKFNAVYKAAIRTYYSKNNEGFSSMPDITNETKIKVAGAKAEAQSNCSKNHTKYSEEWKKILTSNGVDDEAGLYDKFEYEIQKSKFEEKFYDYRFKDKGDGYETNYDVLRKGGYFRDKEGNPVEELEGKPLTKLNGFFNEKQPYHMKHILVRLEKGKQDGDDTNCIISKAEANKIYNIVSYLAAGYDFKYVSDHFGDDKDEAKANDGEVGIMTRDTSYVNDFKLGVYLYEAFYGQGTAKNTTQEEKTINNYLSKEAKAELFPKDGAGAESSASKYATKITEMVDPTNGTSTGIAQIPYGEILKLRNSDVKVASEDEDGIGDIDSSHEETLKRFSANGVDLTKVKEKYLPRNVIFNKYFNKHNIMVITPNTLDEIDAKTNSFVKMSTDKTTVVRDTAADIHTSKVDTTKGYDTLPGFSRTPKNGDAVNISSGNNQVLRDENGRTILVFRSGSSSSKSNDTNDETSGYQGIHFIVIERSPFIGRENESQAGKTTADEKWTSLNEYYTEYYPDQIDGHHPAWYDGEGKLTSYKKTYANFITYQTDPAKLRKRSDKVKTEIKKADDNLNTYIYDYLLGKGQIKFTTTAKETLKIDESINNWIQNTKRGNTAFEKAKTWNETWHKYYNNLKARHELRVRPDGDKTHIEPLIPEICVTAFNGGLSEITVAGKTGTTTPTLAELFKEGGAFNA